MKRNERNEWRKNSQKKNIESETTVCCERFAMIAKATTTTTNQHIVKLNMYIFNTYASIVCCAANLKIFPLFTLVFYSYWHIWMCVKPSLSKKEKKSR